MGTPPPADPGVYISNARMYEEVRGLATTMTRVETKLDGLRDDNRDIRQDLADHESRLRTVEKALWRAAGAAAVVGAGVGIGASLLGH